MSCSITDTGDADATCCAVYGDTCTHTTGCHWRVTDEDATGQVRWCDTHEREFGLAADCT
ncbi:hypothetical protein [Streptomonospora arabica]|uniref:Uncharacterized protein n=1 Tax=Streptomonospora arabica TaxID=412417 RepID=A0ABV9SSL6_9ACTN